MSDRYDLPKIKPDTQPSIVNHEMGEGAFWGNLAGALATLAVPAKFKIASVIGGTAVGGLLGGMRGKSQQEQAAVEGKVVKSPGYWNKGIISGMMAGWVVTAPLGAIIKSKSLVSGGGTLLAQFGGAVVGSIMRKNELQHDFDRAVAVREEETNALRSQLRAAQIAGGVGYKNSVSAPEAAELMAKQERTSLMAEKIHADRAHGEVEAEAAR